MKTITSIFRIGTSITLAMLLAYFAAAADKGSRCDLKGTFFGKNALGVRFVETAAPLDSDGNSVALVLSGYADDDPTFGGRFPTAVSISTFHGEAVRVGPQSYKYTSMAAGTDARHQLVYFIRISGVKKFTDYNCNALSSSGSLSIFLPSQDADGTGLIKDYEKPAACIPCSCSLRRVSIIDGCTP